MKLYKASESRIWHFGWLLAFAIGWTVIICSVVKLWGINIVIAIGIYPTAMAITIFAIIGGFIFVNLLPSIDLRKKR